MAKRYVLDTHALRLKAKGYRENDVMVVLLQSSAYLPEYLRKKTT